MSFIVIEGLDGSGKSTQIRLLKNYLNEKKTEFKYIHFPRTDSPVYGELVARFLRGELGDIHSVNPYLVALIYAGDRKDAARPILDWLKEGYLVLLDRYVYSNIAFQCAKLSDRKEREDLAKWILELEFEYNHIPKPDMNIFLDVPFHFTKHNLTKQRKGQDRDYLNGNKDIHEDDLNFQEKVREMYLWQTDHFNDFHLINCGDFKGNILKPGEILREIITTSGL